MHGVQPEFATTIVLQAEGGAVQKEGVIHVQVVPVCVPSQIFSEVRHLGLLVVDVQVTRVVDWHPPDLNVLHDLLPLGVLVELINVLAQHELLLMVPVLTQTHQFPPLPHLPVLHVHVVVVLVNANAVVQVAGIVVDIVEFLLVHDHLAPHVVIEFLGLIDEFAVEEELREDLVDGRQHQAMEVVAMDDSQSQSIDEHALVDVQTGPGYNMLEGLPVLGIVEQVE